VSTRKADDARGTNGLEHSGERGDCIAGVVSEFADRKNRMEWLGLFLHGDSGTAAQVLLQPSTESERDSKLKKRKLGTEGRDRSKPERRASALHGGSFQRTQD
jgi:hypothetical protein